MVLCSALKWAFAYLFAAVVAVLLAGDFVAAQATPQPSLDAPKPDECLIDPRKFEAPATPVPIPSSGVLPAPERVPSGDPASAEQEAEVTTTVRESLACRNAGDLRRAYALLTDRQIYVLLGGDSGPAPELLFLLENRGERVPRDERLELVEVRDVQSMPDGRLRATVATRNAFTTFTDLLLFAEQDGRWLIDDSIAVSWEPRD